MGEPYARAVRDVLEQLAAATALATARRSESTLNVSTSDGFAGRWLVPRLYRFHVYKVHEALVRRTLASEPDR